MRPLFCLAALLLALAGCSTPESPYADDASIRAVSYRQPGPATITLYTMVRNSTGKGGHSALLINASERVIFDPAGSFYLNIVPERNDVLYGITPRVEFAYRSGHARKTYHVLSQTIEVTPEQAELAYRLAVQNGAVAAAFCSDSTSKLLRQVPGFESLNSTLFPTNLAEQFSKLPGVVESRYYEDDDPDIQVGLEENNAALGPQETQ